jgi:phosphoribosylformylglycinamidine (FGAM) synthase-like amidotransferase family enzyme
MVDVPVLVLTGYGINCEEETEAAFRLAGAQPVRVHLNRLLAGEVSLAGFRILALPGGFSFGDDLGAGKALANKLRYAPLPDGRPFFDELRSFLDQGGHVIGICNGFQVLVKTGLLPNIGGRFEQEVSLVANDSGRFEDRWCRCVVREESGVPALGGLHLLELPVRHGEGRLVCRDRVVREAIVAESLDCLRYCDGDGCPTMVYPWNPNGSDLSVAGLTDRSRRILGLMPHPEAFLSGCNHPDWAGRRRRDSAWDERGTGLSLFANLVRHLKEEA